MSQPPSEDPSKSAEGQATETPRASFGSWLRHQREARSVSMREIADNSKISLRYLEALEQDRFDVLPAPVFARGFLREYARVVGLNPDEVVNLYLVAIEERAEGNRRMERPKTARPESSRSAPSSLGYGLLLGLAVVLFVGIAALLSFLAERRRAAPVDSRLVAPATMAAPAAANPGTDGTAALPLARPPAGSPDPGRAVSQAVPGDAVAGEAAAAPATGGSLASAPEAGGSPGVLTAGAVAGPYRVVLNFSQDCWMESVVDGNRRTSELKAAGETVALEAFESVLLTLGNSRAVTVEVDGQPFALPENSTRVVRELRIERPGRLPPMPPMAPIAPIAPIAPAPQVQPPSTAPSTPSGPANSPIPSPVRP